ncbi:MAG: hypothetical protein FWE34_07625 [Defluviitaleaceae bacterium]|nr:hypothetical protein [Defluviitaleaceae bacterium]
MAYETKVILSLLADHIGKAKSVKEAYNVVVKAANVEGLKLPSYEEFQKELEELAQEEK